MISEKMLDLGERSSVIREIAGYAAARKLEIGAENVYDFSIGNPSVPAPAKVNETIVRLIATVDSVELHGYTASAGSMEARSAAARRESLRAGHDIPASCVYMTCGAAASLTVALKAIMCEGDKVIVMAPYFPEYKVFIENAGGEMIAVQPADLSMQPDLAALERAVDEHVKALIINSPNNPSGAIYSRETLSAIAEILNRACEKYSHEIYLLADEPYRELIYGDVEVPFVPNIYRNTIVCYSYSKSLSLPGERIGYILVPPTVDGHEKLFSAVCGAGRSMGFVCAPSLMQKVIVECAGESPDLASYDSNRRLLYDSLTEMGFECVKPDGAFYLFMKVPNGDAMEFYKTAMKYELMLVPSDSFGMPGYVRIAYCTSEAMIRNALPSFRKLAAECLK